MAGDRDRESKRKKRRPGEIPDPPERSWDDEPPDPYEGVSRESPFKGRPRTEVYQPEEPELDAVDDPGPDEPIPPGQPLPRSRREQKDR